MPQNELKQGQWSRAISVSHDLFESIPMAIFRPSENVDDSANMDAYDPRNLHTSSY